MTDEALDRDIFDQLFLKLADIGPDGNTVGDQGFRPALAARWDWASPVALVFHLDPRARWHDGRAVTAGDVAFTFASYTDSTIDSPDRANLSHIVSVEARDSATAVFTFDRRYPEMFFDAVYHMRILPAHLLAALPHSQWRTAAFGRTPVGDGPYDLVRWTAGQDVELAADSTFFLGRPHLRRLVWRFTPDLSVAVTQVVAGDADAIQVLVAPDNIERATAASHLTLYRYPGSVYTLVTFNLRANGDRTTAHPILADVAVRRALVLATDRARMAQSILRGHGRVPPGPLSEMWMGLWFSDIVVPPFDTAQADRLLDGRGWKTGRDGIRVRGGTRMTIHLAVPSSSGMRKAYATLLQEELRAVGVEVMIDQMEAATMQDRERTGRFDAAIESWNTDPSATSNLAEAWLEKGPSNFGGYANPRFDSAVGRALASASPGDSRRAWHDALATLASDSPGIILSALDNVAAVDSRVSDVTFRPDYWGADLRNWRIRGDRLTARDRAER
ncbi:MAG TPA: peptide ABC transporter substrate-binding protein [Gemmatimonadales bacterium]